MSAPHDTHLPSREELAALITQPISARWKSVSLALAVIGMAIFLIGAVMGEQRAWLAWHVNWLFVTVLSSAGATFAAVQRITTARWSRAVVRIIEGYVAWLPIGFVMLLITIVFGRSYIFPWVNDPPAQPEKRLWLGTLFWSARAIVIYGAMTVLSLWFVYTSVRLDVGILPEWGARWARRIRDRMRAGFGEERRELHSTHSRQGKLAVFLVLLFGFGWVVLSWDLSMSVDPHFQSTMYGWQFFIGAWLGALMLLALLARFWKTRLGNTPVITENHYHDIGKLCFAFTAFWGYLTFGQLLVIWYGNLGEETHFMRLRLIEPWTPLTLAVGILMFALPFFGLLGKYPKVWSPTMIFFAGGSLLGLWIHRYLEIYPVIFLQRVRSMPIGFWEVGVTAGFLGLWGWAYLSFMDAFPRMRVFMLTSPYRDEVQVPVDPATMEPLPAHE